MHICEIYCWKYQEKIQFCFKFILKNKIKTQFKDQKPHHYEGKEEDEGIV